MELNEKIEILKEILTEQLSFKDLEFIKSEIETTKNVFEKYSDNACIGIKPIKNLLELFEITTEHLNIVYNFLKQET